jgi:hypothetical protein
MANQITNELTIKGPKESIDRLFDFALNENNGFDFNRIFPIPEHQPDLKKPNAFWAKGDLSEERYDLFGDNNWYDWCIQNWGTQWNAYNTDVTRPLKEGDVGKIVFITAWNSVDDIVRELSAEFPQLEITYDFESAMTTYAGSDVIKNGDYLSSISGAKYFVYKYGDEPEFFINYCEEMANYIADFEELGRKDIANIVRLALEE